MTIMKAIREQPVTADKGSSCSKCKNAWHADMYGFALRATHLRTEFEDFIWMLFDNDVRARIESIELQIKYVVCWVCRIGRAALIGKSQWEIVQQINWVFIKCLFIFLLPNNWASVNSKTKRAQHRKGQVITEQISFAQMLLTFSLQRLVWQCTSGCIDQVESNRDARSGTRIWQSNSNWTADVERRWANIWLVTA